MGAKNLSRSSNRSSAPFFSSATSDLHQLGFLVPLDLIDLSDEAVGQLLQLLLRATKIVLRDPAFALELLELVLVVPAHVANRHPSLLGPVMNRSHELLAPFLRERRERQPDDRSVVRGGDPKVAAHYRLFYRSERVAVERLDREQPRLWDTHRSELVEGHGRSVVLDRDPVEERGGRAAGSYP